MIGKAMITITFTAIQAATIEGKMGVDGENDAPVKWFSENEYGEQVKYPLPDHIKKRYRWTMPIEQAEWCAYALEDDAAIIEFNMFEDSLNPERDRSVARSLRNKAKEIRAKIEMIAK